MAPPAGQILHNVVGHYEENEGLLVHVESLVSERHAGMLPAFNFAGKCFGNGSGSSEFPNVLRISDN